MLNSEKLYDRLISSGLAEPKTIIGCNEQELNEIKSLATDYLPDSYLDFMARFGKRAGRFLRDIDIYYPKILELRDDAKYTVEVICKEYQLTLPTNAFVFSMRQGEQFMFFELDKNANQFPVMFYIEQAQSFVKVADCFWDFIAVELELEERLYEELKGTPYLFE